MLTRVFYFSIICTILAFFASCGAEQDDDQFESDHHHTGTTNKIDFDTYNQKISYCIGLDHARGCYQVYNGAQARDAFNILEIKAGMVDYLSDKDLRIDFLKKDSLLDLYLLPNGEVDELAVSKNDASYCIGMDEAFILVSSLVGRKIDQEVEVDFILKGIIEGFSGTNDPSIPYMEARRNLDQYYGDLNLENGKAFLAENRQFEGIIETESGLQYEVIKEGTGKRPNLTDSVTIHYTGRYIDGRVFESTVPSNVPYQGSLMNVIDGWQEGVMLMKEGGQTRLYVPHELAYGPQGKGMIEPYSTLVFDIELLDVKQPH